jgi:ferredoxin/nitrate reductase gamma subunit
MTRRVNSSLLYELKKYGAEGAEKCINCGNCTAICSLASNDDLFPRRMVRLAQLGMKNELLASRELWLCYNCGNCSETCPQQAEPANLMAAARCYAIANYIPFKIGSMFCGNPFSGSLVAVFLVLFFCAFMYSNRQAMATDALRLFGFIPYPLIHDTGLAVMAGIGLISLAAIVTMISRIFRFNGLGFKDLLGGPRRNWMPALWDAAVVQSLGQKRYRRECELPGNVRAWYLKKWFVHASTMWGFLGLLFATALDYLLDIVGIKETGTFVSLWYPTRLIGTLSGLLFMYGVSILIYRRLKAADKAHALSRYSDWNFLALLGLSGMTGFVIEIALYLPGVPEWGYWVFVFHFAVSITLLLLLPFTKFAHVVYRVAALYIRALKPVGRRESVPAGADSHAS